MPATIAVGRRKDAIARVKLTEGSGKITVNKREFEKYFPLETHRGEVMRPFVVTDTVGRYDATINVQGGGMTGQAGAVKLGIARSLVSVDEDMRTALRGAGEVFHQSYSLIRPAVWRRRRHSGRKRRE